MVTRDDPPGAVAVREALRDAARGVERVALVLAEARSRADRWGGTGVSGTARVPWLRRGDDLADAADLHAAADRLRAAADRCDGGGTTTEGSRG